VTQRGGGGDPISAEALAAAEHARLRAQAEMPAPEALAAMTAAAATGADAMTPAEIRRLAAAAISQSQQIAHLLGRLAVLMDEEEEQPR
jgi:hypothetical protein